jgi:hypothetical protein
MKPLPLLLTATVDPKDTPGADFTPPVREEMYIQTLQFYCSELENLPETHIVFAENSGWNLSRIKASLPVHAPVEFVSISPDIFQPARGKGFNEVVLIQETLYHCSTLETGFLKVTGRYPIYNIRHFLEEASKALLQEGKELYIDIKDHGLYSRLGLNWASRFADVRIFASSKGFFLKEVASELSFLDDNAGRMFEGLMYNLVKPRLDHPALVYRFNREPHFGGVEGSQIQALSFSKNQDSLKGKMKRLTGNILRFIAPDFLF